MYNMLFPSSTSRCFFNLLTAGNYFIAREVKVFFYALYRVFFLHNCCARTWSEIPISPCMRWLSRSVSLSLYLYLRPDPAWPGLACRRYQCLRSELVRVDRCGNIAPCGKRNRVVIVLGWDGCLLFVKVQTRAPLFFALFLWHYYLYLRLVFFLYSFFFFSVCSHSIECSFEMGKLRFN